MPRWLLRDRRRGRYGRHCARARHGAKHEHLPRSVPRGYVLSDNGHRHPLVLRVGRVLPSGEHLSDQVSGWDVPAPGESGEHRCVHAMRAWHILPCGLRLSDRLPCWGVFRQLEPTNMPEPLWTRPLLRGRQLCANTVPRKHIQPLIPGDVGGPVRSLQRRHVGSARLALLHVSRLRTRHL